MASSWCHCRSASSSVLSSGQTRHNCGLWRESSQINVRNFCFIRTVKTSKASALQEIRIVAGGVAFVLTENTQVEASATEHGSPHSLGQELGTAEKCQLCKQSKMCYQQKYN